MTTESTVPRRECCISCRPAIDALCVVTSIQLQIADARDVYVVVSRWFGGIMLGPDRFKHINNAARHVHMCMHGLRSCGALFRAALEQFGFIVADKKGQSIHTHRG